MDRFIIGGAPYDVEVPYESLTDLNLASSGWLHCAWKNQVLYFTQSKVFVFNIVPLSVIHPLAQQFEWWLASRFILSGHVQVI